jgi:hypothetical protein
VFDQVDYLVVDDYTDEGIFRVAVSCLSNNVVRKMLDEGFQAVPYDLTLAAESYNRVAHAEIMASGIEPSDEHANMLLNNADRSRIWNTMIVDLTRYGYNYTDRQKDRIEAISLTASKEVDRLETKSKYWQRTCRVKNNIVTPELKREAVNHGIYPSESKKSICEGIAKSDVKAQSAVCTNRHMMKRDYSDLEMVKYVDGEDTWCFTYENFDQILQDGMNPFTGRQLPDYVLAEMDTKKRSFGGEE